MEPRRKHFGHGDIARSAQGRAMLAMLQAYLGTGVSYTPVAFVRPDAHVFMLQGWRGHALLVERAPTREGSVWVGVTAARLGDAARGPALNVELTTHTWDPWLEAECTGDRSIIDGPRRARYRLQDARTAEVAGRRDRLEVTCVPHGVASTTLAGLPYQALVAGYPDDASSAILDAPGSRHPDADRDITVQLRLIRAAAGQEEAVARALAVSRRAGGESDELSRLERAARTRLDVVLAAHPCICACEDFPCECGRCVVWCDNRIALDELQPSHMHAW
jgi:hypothetical protein